MDSEPLVEVLVAILALVYFTARWIYRRIKATISRRRTPMAAEGLASPIPTLIPPTSPTRRRVVVPSALGSLVGVLLASLAFAVWVSSQDPVPPSTEHAAAFFSLWFCVGAPLVCAFSAVAVTIADNTFMEFQARRLPRGVPFALGLIIGIAFSLASASLIPSIPCDPLGTC